MNAFAHIVRVWRGRRGRLAFGVAVSLASLAAGVALSAVAGGLVARLTAGSVAGIAAFAAAPLALRLLGPARVALRYAERLATHDALFRALADLRVWLFRGLARGAAGGLGFRRAGDVLDRLVSDVEALDGLYIRILVPLAGAVLLAPVVTAVVWTVSPALAVGVGAALCVACLVVPAVAARLAWAQGAQLASAGSGLRITLLDAVTGLREVRAFGAEGRTLAAAQARESALLSAQRAQAGTVALTGAAAFLAAQAAILAALAIAGEREGASRAGAIVAVFLIVAAFEAVGGLSRAGALAGRSAAAAARVVEAASALPGVMEPATPVPLGRSTAIRFEGVTYRWAPDRAPVFEGLTLDVPAGARVALLGPSGAGKSTLAALLLKVVAPQAGRILLGGRDLAELASADVRAQVGWLSQATHLFDDTIRANLRLADPSADDAALWGALDAARVGALVRALPERLDTWVGEGGSGLSGGQARRIALARALLSRAPILVLDEPAAGLDARTEREFLSLLNDVGEGRTLILITHRLTGVERLDRIWRLSAGQAVAAAA